MGIPVEAWGLEERSEVCRACTRCAGVLNVTPEDELACSRCGRRVSAWTVTVKGRVVAAGRRSARGGVSIWLAGTLDDLRPDTARAPALARSGWSEEE